MTPSRIQPAGIATNSGDGNNARMELRERVLALINASKVQQMEQMATFQSLVWRFETSFRLWVSWTWRKITQPQQLEEETYDNMPWERELEELRRWIVRDKSAMRHELVRLLARNATLRKKSRKRQRGEMFPPEDSEKTDVNVKHVINSITTLMAVWFLHEQGLVRFEDVLVAVPVSSSQPTGNEMRCAWVCGPIHKLLCRASAPICWIDKSRQKQWGAGDITTHDMAKSILQNCVRVAFGNVKEVAVSSPHEPANVDPYFMEAKIMAKRVLQGLCDYTSTFFSIPSLRVVTDLLVSLHHDKQQKDGCKIVRFGIPISTNDVAGFLNPLLLSFISKSHMESPYNQNDMEQIFAAFQSCIPSEVIVQLLRQLAYESSNNNSTAQSRVATFSNGIIYQLILSNASRDHRFAAYVLTLAHELAETGLLKADAELLSRSLEIVATISESLLSPPSRSAASVDCYRMWFRAHFGTNEEPKPNKVSEDGQNAAASGVSCLKDATRCSLITSKRQLQFICAFLLEYDRQQSRYEESNIPALQWSAEHVAVHLSVIKSHQSQHPGGLIMSFCSQTRTRYLELLKKEDRGMTAVSRKLPAFRSNPVQQTVSDKTRALVREEVAYYRKNGKFSSQLQKWKTFQYQEWKTDILPCILDISVSNSIISEESEEGEHSGLSKGASNQVAFVVALAKNNMVPAMQFAQFVTRMETWIEKRRQELQNRANTRRSNGLVKDLRDETDRLKRIALMRRTSPDCAQMSITEQLRRIGETLLSAFELLKVVTYECRDVPSRISENQMCTIWDYGFIKVFDALGGDLDLFLQFQLPLLLQVKGVGSHKYEDDCMPMLEMFSRHCLAQVVWDEPIKEGLVNTLTCAATVVGALVISLNGVKQASDSISSMFNQFDANIMSEENCAIVTQPFSASIIKKSVFCTALFRVINAGPKSAIGVATSSNFLSRSISRFMAWICYRSIHYKYPSEIIEVSLSSCDEEQLRTRNLHHHLLRFVVDNQVLLYDKQWYRHFVCLHSETHQYETNLTTQLLQYELRYGQILFGELHSPGTADMFDDVQLCLFMIEETSLNRATSSGEVCRWIITEVFAMASQLEFESTQDNHPIIVALCVLNDLMQRSSNGESNFLCYVMEIFVNKLNTIEKNICTNKKQIFRVGFELLGCCLRHDTAPPKAESILKLMRSLQNDYERRMPWQWVRVLFMLTARVLSDSDVDSLSLKVENLPVSILVQWGLNYHLIQSMLESKTSHVKRDTPIRSNLLRALQWFNTFFSQVWQHISETGHPLLVQSSHIQASQGTVGVYDHSLIVPTIFATFTDSVLCQVQSIRWLYKWNWFALEDPLTTIASNVHEFASFVADHVFRCCCTQSDHGMSRHASPQLIEDLAASDLMFWLAAEWFRITLGTNATPDFFYQLLLVNVGYQLCLNTALASKKFLSESRDQTSIEPLKNALFLILIGAVALKSKQLDRIIAHNGSLWVNRFPRIALHVHTCCNKESSKSSTSKVIDATANMFVSILGNSSSFQDVLLSILREVIAFGVDNNIDLLDPSIPADLTKVWPHLGDAVAQLQILCLDDSAYY